MHTYTSAHLVNYTHTAGVLQTDRLKNIHSCYRPSHRHTYTQRDDNGFCWNLLSVFTCCSNPQRPLILVRQILSTSSLSSFPTFTSRKPAGKTLIMYTHTHTLTRIELLNTRQVVVFWDFLMYLCIWLLLNNTSLFVIFPAYTPGEMERSGNNKSRAVLKYWKYEDKLSAQSTIAYILF